MCDVVGSGQSMTAETLSAFGVMPLAETATPAKTALDWNSLHFAGASDSPFSRHLLKNFWIFGGKVVIRYAYIIHPAYQVFVDHVI